MKIKVPLLFWIIIAVVSGCRAIELDRMVGIATARALEQCRILDDSLSATEMPKSFIDGVLKKSDAKYWCSGFFPGTCWYCYALSGDDSMKSIAVRRTAALLDPDSYYKDHDIGFQIMSSAGLAYKYTGDTSYLPAIKRSAELLASRFSPTTGTLRSWNNTKFSYPVIIDNMMNLELLTFASRQFDVPQWKEIAVTHANTTMNNHFREDGSSFHLVDYDENTGGVLQRVTVQGYADSSAWSRGQSWALYGFTMMYRETSDEKYLEKAEKIAAFLLPLLAGRPVPAWDFNAPGELSVYDDASAGAVMASAFLELSRLTKDRDRSEAYLLQAEQTLTALCSDRYLAEAGELGGFILKHSTGNMPAGKEVDVPLSYADYYFLESLVRYSASR